MHANNGDAGGSQAGSGLCQCSVAVVSDRTQLIVCSVSVVWLRDSALFLPLSAYPGP